MGRRWIERITSSPAEVTYHAATRQDLYSSTRIRCIESSLKIQKSRLPRLKIALFDERKVIKLMIFWGTTGNCAIFDTNYTHNVDHLHFIRILLNAFVQRVAC